MRKERNFIRKAARCGNEKNEKLKDMKSKRAQGARLREPTLTAFVRLKADVSKGKLEFFRNAARGR